MRNILSFLPVLVLFWAGCDSQVSTLGSERGLVDKIDQLSSRIPAVFEGTSADRREIQASLIKVARGQALRGGLDDLFLAMGEQIEGFGGLYFDSNQQLVASAASLDGPFTEARATQVRDGVRGLAISLLNPEYDGDKLLAVRVEEAKYSFAELVYWKTQVIQKVGFSEPGAWALDADEARNMVVLTSDTELRDLESILKGLRIPSDAVMVVVAERPHLVRGRVEPTSAVRTAKITDRVRPVRGGLGIQNNGCTIGIPVWYDWVSDPTPETNPWGYLTAAHCSEWVDLLGRDFYQKGYLVSNDEIGTEIKETSMSFCASGGGDPCLAADAVLIDHVAGLDQEVGDVYLTETLGYKSSFDIDELFHATLDRSPLFGETVQKVGVKTAWVEGTVTGTCADTSTGPFHYHVPWGDPNGTPQHLNLVVECMSKALMSVESGDSGGPIFKNRAWTGSWNVGDFLGIVSWANTAGTVVGFSPYYEIASAINWDVRTRLE